MAIPQQDRARLLNTAKAVASKLKTQSKGTAVRVRIPNRVWMMDTDGWNVVIGNLGKNQPRLEIWFDRFAGYPERKLYAGFRSEDRQQITYLTKSVSRKLWPVREVNLDDTTREKYLVLSRRLKRAEFNAPILEKYRGGRTYYGLYDPTRDASTSVNPHFCARATAFFEDVARALPHAAAADEQREVYPQIENRRRVVSHLQRERSRLLATECKIRDQYECQVCGLRFEQEYGRLGSDFAEAHHRVPLSQLREHVKTRIEDLATVCANCHRMLHRMSGKRDDIRRLRAVVRKRQGKRR